MIGKCFNVADTGLALGVEKSIWMSHLAENVDLRILWLVSMGGHYVEMNQVAYELGFGRPLLPGLIWNS